MKIAFVRNPKTGSSSMRRALPDSVITDAHQPLSYYLGRGLKTFAFVRNPWERTHSWWRHQNYCKTETFRDYVMRRALTEEYVHGRLRTGLPINDQYQWLYHEEHRVDIIGRFEHLEEDFAHITETLGIELAEPLAHRNKSVRRETHPYRPGVWDAEMIEHMSPLFAPLAEEFGYTDPLGGWPKNTLTHMRES